MQTCVQDK